MKKSIWFIIDFISIVIIVAALGKWIMNLDDKQVGASESDNLTNEYSLTEKELEQVYQGLRAENNEEWITYDFNSDGVKEAILRDSKGQSDVEKRILAIFAKTEEGYKRIFWDSDSGDKYYAFNDGHFFLCQKYQTNRSLYDGFLYNCYVEYSFNQAWELQSGRKIEAFYIPNVEEWRDSEEYYMIGAPRYELQRKLYYRTRLGIEKDGEHRTLTEQEWDNFCQDITGASFQSMEPERYEEYEKIKQRLNTEEIFEACLKEWYVDECLGTQDTEAPYLGKVLNMNAENIEALDSITEEGYEFESWQELEEACNPPLEICEVLDAPFYAARIKLKDMDDVVELIMGANHWAVLAVGENFYRLRKPVRIYQTHMDVATFAMDEIGRSDCDSLEYGDIEEFGDVGYWPAEMVSYLIEALRTDTLIERLLDIQADYEIVEEEERKILSKSKRDNELGITVYAPQFAKDDVWYRLSLSEFGDDIVVCHEMAEGYVYNYYFMNVEAFGIYSEPAFTMGGQKRNHPYFITWDGTNYIVIPCWNRAEDRIIGMAVYDYYHYINGSALSIGINSDGTPYLYEQVSYLTTGTASSYHAQNSTGSPMIFLGKSITDVEK